MASNYKLGASGFMALYQRGYNAIRQQNWSVTTEVYMLVYNYIYTYSIYSIYA